MLLQEHLKGSSTTEVNSSAYFTLYSGELFISTVDELENVSSNWQTAIQSKMEFLQ